MSNQSDHGVSEQEAGREVEENAQLAELHSELLTHFMDVAPETFKALQGQTVTRVNRRASEQGVIFESTSYFKLGDHKIAQDELAALRRAARDHMMPVDFHTEITKVVFKDSGNRAIKIVLIKYQSKAKEAQSMSDTVESTEAPPPAETPAAEPATEPAAPSTPDPVVEPPPSGKPPDAPHPRPERPPPPPPPPPTAPASPEPAEGADPPPPEEPAAA